MWYRDTSLRYLFGLRLKGAAAVVDVVYLFRTTHLMRLDQTVKRVNVLQHLEETHGGNCKCLPSITIRPFSSHLTVYGAWPEGRFLSVRMFLQVLRGI